MGKAILLILILPLFFLPIQASGNSRFLQLSVVDVIAGPGEQSDSFIIKITAKLQVNQSISIDDLILDKRQGSYLRQYSDDTLDEGDNVREWYFLLNEAISGQKTVEVRFKAVCSSEESLIFGVAIYSTGTVLSLPSQTVDDHAYTQGCNTKKGILDFYQMHLMVLMVAFFSTARKFAISYDDPSK